MDFVWEKSAAKKINQLYLEAVTLLKKNLVIFGSASTFSRAHKLNGPQGKKEVSVWPKSDTVLCFHTILEQK